MPVEKTVRGIVEYVKEYMKRPNGMPQKSQRVYSMHPDTYRLYVLIMGNKRELRRLVREAKWERRNKAKKQRILRNLTFYAGE